ncbi:AAA family ATPase [Bacillus sp. L27]|uniref:AAA family ATPase n=1 Tax=Bacillus sp. L27 TaxID=1866312 RepID=UPI0008FE8C32|nr:AAA family ATPase [Bacillus sp. L27]OJD48995.1 hypothetical protein BAU24_12090 [Bacillus sp. L27]
MEIIYLYIHSYKHLQQIELNFSPLYKLSLLEKGNVQVIENSHVPAHFFSHSINSIHGIVGKNGLGKSTIFEILSGSFTNKASFFIVMKRGKNFFISKKNYQHKIQLQNHLNKKLQQKIIPIINTNSYKVQREKVKTQTTYLHPNLSITNFSTKLNINYDNVYSIDLLSTNLSKLSPTIFRNEVNIDLILSNMLKHSLNAQINFTIEFDKEKFMQRYPGARVLIEEWLPKVPLNLSEKLHFYVLIDELETSSKVVDTKLIEEIHAYEPFLPSRIIHEKFGYNPDRVIFSKFIKSIEKENKKQLQKYTKNFNAKHTLKLPKEIGGFLHNLRILLERLKHLKVPFTYEISNLSQGETSLYHFIVLLNGTLRFLERSRTKSSILLIDEIEAFLHPEWCRNLIDIIIGFIKRYNIQDVQVILSTHSPYILSDLPRECITKLHKNSINNSIQVFHDEKETFAANINDLLIDAFFMEGTIGEFAKKKINDVLNTIKSSDLLMVDHSTIQFVISIIGDPIIRKILQQQYEQKLQELNPKQAVEEKIKQLEKEIYNLQKSLEEKIDDSSSN